MQYCLNETPAQTGLSRYLLTPAQHLTLDSPIFIYSHLPLSLAHHMGIFLCKSIECILRSSSPILYPKIISFVSPIALLVYLLYLTIII